MKNRAMTLAFAAALVAIIACKSSTAVSKIVTFTATMNGAGEVPATTSTGSGTFTATLDTSTNLFTWDLSFTGLSANATAGHIHGPSAATATAGVILNFANGTTFTLGAASGTGHGSIVLNAATTVSTTVNGDSLRKLLLAGLTYANVHTSANPGGEIRGQITKQ